MFWHLVFIWTLCRTIQPDIVSPYLLQHATGVACQQGTLTPPGHLVPPLLGACICSDCWDQFSKLHTELMTVPNLTFTERFPWSICDGWHASRERLPFRTPGSVPLFGTCLCSSCWDQIPQTCHVFTRLFTLNTPWYFLVFASYYVFCGGAWLVLVYSLFYIRVDDISVFCVTSQRCTGGNEDNIP